MSEADDYSYRSNDRIAALLESMAEGEVRGHRAAIFLEAAKRLREAVKDGEVPPWMEEHGVYVSAGPLKGALITREKVNNLLPHWPFAPLYRIRTEEVSDG